MDVYSPEKRSEVMAKIKAKDTKPEIAVRKLLHRMGYRFRLHNKNLPGKPDVCLRKYNAVILIHGCFWHSHKKCRDGRLPKSNLGYWKPKIEGNIARDVKNKIALKKQGWKVITVWECELKDLARLEKRLLKELMR